MEEANSWITEKYAIKKDILMVKDFEEKSILIKFF